MKNYYYRKLKAKKNRGVIPLYGSSHSHSHSNYHTLHDSATVNIVRMTCPICKTNDIKQYSRHCPICGIKFSYKILKGKDIE